METSGDRHAERIQGGLLADGISHFTLVGLHLGRPVPKNWAQSQAAIP